VLVSAMPAGYASGLNRNAKCGLVSHREQSEVARERLGFPGPRDRAGVLSVRYSVFAGSMTRTGLPAFASCAIG